jgi:arylsulfatase A-like enzyme
MVRSLDQNVGRVLAKLDELGIADRTVVFFFSDNGGYVGTYDGQIVTDNHPLRSGKGSLYEGGIREPLIVRWPGVTEPGSVCHEPVISYDFYPTMLEMAGLQNPPGNEIDGEPLTPLLQRPDAGLGREALYWHYPHYYHTTGPVSAIRQGDWKLLEYLEDGHLELYHLSQDVGEKDNRAAELPQKARQLHGRLKAWREEVQAQMPRPNPEFR